jgi:diguanylate cyclase (GGDEF)-like protein
MHDPGAPYWERGIREGGLDYPHELLASPTRVEVRNDPSSPWKKLLRLPSLTALVTFGALALFIWIGGPALSLALEGISTGNARLDPITATAVLLNVSLIALGWQRSRALAIERAARSIAEDRASTAAYRDFTTGLLNRRGFVLALEYYLGKAERIGIALLDLDHFKRVNDAYGHAAGDAILQAVSDILKRAAPAGAEIARLGGDEFAILLSGRDACREKAATLAETVRARLYEPLRVDGIDAQVGVSIGIVLGEDSLDSPSILMRRSDIAMYEAKKAGRNQVAWFTAAMEEELQRRTKLEADMRSGIEAGQFVPFYQPQLDLLSGEIHGFEVLARWEHPEQGVIEPADFIPVAEATGMIGPLSMSVMKQALLETLHWDQGLLIAVNLSPVQLKDPLLAQRITKLLAETGFPARRLELEITESSLFDDLELALATVESLKNQGITISLDDFGTGYSSLTQLQALPFDRIKIDRSFVTSMIDNPESAAIVSAITSLGASLKLPVTAEGVETNAIQQSLQALGCSKGQGWHFGRPLRASDAKAFLDLAPTALGEAAAVQIAVSGVPPAAGDRRDRDRRGKSRRSAA